MPSLHWQFPYVITQHNTRIRHLIDKDQKSHIWTGPGSNHHTPVHSRFPHTVANMSANKGRIKSSPILTLPHGGRVGLLREIGTVTDHGTMFEAWTAGLRDRQLRIHDLKGALNDDCTSIKKFIYDEATERLVASLETRENSSTLFTM